VTRRDGVLDRSALMVMTMLMSDVPTVELGEQLRRANAGLRDVLEARDAENAELRAALHALSLQVADLQRRLGSGSDDSGMPSSKRADRGQGPPQGRTCGSSGRARWVVAAAVHGEVPRRSARTSRSRPDPGPGPGPTAASRSAGRVPWLRR
jgi:hypothetical protein